jgi:hypothetical protein
MPSLTISDGLTRTAKLAADDGRPALWIEYRPMLSTDRGQLLRRIAALASEGIAGVVLAENLVLQELNSRIASLTLLLPDAPHLIVDITELRQIEPIQLAALARLVLDLEGTSLEAERIREANLTDGLRLMLTRPRLALRDCGDCQKHVYDERSGRRATHAGHPVARPPGTSPPCRLEHIGCPKGTPELPKTLSQENLQTIRHYHECRAIGLFPDDPIVRRNASLIRRVESTIERLSAR